MNTTQTTELPIIDFYPDTNVDVTVRTKGVIGGHTGLAYLRFPYPGWSEWDMAEEGYTLIHLPSQRMICGYTVPTEELAREWLAYVSTLTDWDQDMDAIKSLVQQGKLAYRLIDLWLQEKRAQAGKPCSVCYKMFFPEELTSSAKKLTSYDDLYTFDNLKALYCRTCFRDVEDEQPEEKEERS